MGARVKLIEADFDHALPFADGRFAAAASRLALMIATDPVATLRELRRVTAAGGRIVTALWAPVDENPWFALPRAAAAAVVGPERADYARAFGRLGSPEEATQVHRAAGLADVQATTLRETLDVPDATDLWSWMVGENGHVRRLDATLSVSERAAVLDELDRLVAGHRTHDDSLRSSARHDARDSHRLTWLGADVEIDAGISSRAPSPDTRSTAVARRAAVSIASGSDLPVAATPGGRQFRARLCRRTQIGSPSREKHCEKRRGISAAAGALRYFRRSRWIRDLRKDGTSRPGETPG